MRVQASARDGEGMPSRLPAGRLACPFRRWPVSELLERIGAATLPEDSRAILLLVAVRPRAAAELRAALVWRRHRVKSALTWLSSQGWIARVDQHTRVEEDQVYELDVSVPRRLGLEPAPWTPTPAAADPYDRAIGALRARTQAEEELQRAHLALMLALAELPICDDCPVGGRDGEGLPCPRAPVCDTECAAHSTVFAEEAAGEASSDAIWFRIDPCGLEWWRDRV